MDLVERYKLALELEQRESDRYWVRNNTMLLVEGALASFYTASLDRPAYLLLLVGGFGLFLAVAWYGMLRAGKCYVASWDYAARHFENKLRTAEPGWIGLREVFDMGEEQFRRTRFLQRSSTSFMSIVIVGTALFWVTIMAATTAHALF